MSYLSLLWIIFHVFKGFVLFCETIYCTRDITSYIRSRFPVLDVIVVVGRGGIVVLKLILALIPVEILKEEKGVENENLLKESLRGTWERQEEQ